MIVNPPIKFICDLSTSMDILIVEDGRALRMAMASVIEDAGHNAVQAEDGEKSLEILSERMVDLIFMDVEMPGISGFEATTKIRAELGDHWIPIIFLTGKSDDASYLEGIEAGGDDYLVKPVSPIIMSAKITAMKRIVDMRNELNKLNEELELLSQIDGLTQLYNHRTFMSFAQDQWALAMRNNTSLALLMLDIDHFKLFNDFYGHPSGDQCLKQIAQTLKGVAQRPTDTVGRYGGEEFIILLPDTDLEGAILIGEKIKQAISDLNIEHKQSKSSDRVSASIGISFNNTTSGRNLSDIIKYADELMYQSKNEGRDRVTTKIYQPNSTILIAYDDCVSLTEMKVQLSEHYRVLTSTNGEECIDLAKVEKPDLILMDINIPVIDGIEVSKNLKGDRSTSSIPIILTSAVIDDSEKHSIIKESHANAFMGKPIDNTRLLQKINNFIT